MKSYHKENMINKSSRKCRWKTRRWFRLWSICKRENQMVLIKLIKKLNKYFKINSFERGIKMWKLQLLVKVQEKI